MSYGILGLNETIRGQAKAGLADVAEQERQRNHMNKQLKTAATAEEKSMMMTGAGMGMALGGPIGAVIGFGAGKLLNDLF